MGLHEHEKVVNSYDKIDVLYPLTISINNSIQIMSDINTNSLTTRDECGKIPLMMELIKNNVG